MSRVGDDPQSDDYQRRNSPRQQSLFAPVSLEQELVPNTALGAVVLPLHFPVTLLRPLTAVVIGQRVRLGAVGHTERSLFRKSVELRPGSRRFPRGQQLQDRYPLVAMA